MQRAGKNEYPELTCAKDDHEEEAEAEEEPHLLKKDLRKLIPGTVFNLSLFFFRNLKLMCLWI